LQHFILLISYTRAKSAAVFDYTRLKRLSRNKHSNLFVPSVSYEETEDLRIHTQSAQRKCIVGTAWRVHSLLRVYGRGFQRSSLQLGLCFIILG